MKTYYCPTCQRIIPPDQVFGCNEPPDENGDRPSLYHRMSIYAANVLARTYIHVSDDTHPLLVSIDGRTV